ncbi:MAG TPA: flippase activity-associated protein Agl23, partial [Thermomicrobiales bacterium]|nr:flippase activity-associated protein Agl23 [Thermomicrobiales bacterium]
MNQSPRQRSDRHATRNARRLPPVSGAAVAVAAGTTSSAIGVEPARRAPIQLRFNVEFILYSVIAGLAVLTRFWDLSSRAEHHDESLHAYYSWLFYVGEGYIHDPLMHGPTLFHTNAFAYLLFGDNDYTSRLWPALLGVILVLMPAMLRGPRLLGRWGALTCSALLLFSPSLLYQSRYIRHDPLVLVMTMAIVIAALRYLERPERKWIVTVAVMAGLLFATMEVSFIIAFVLVSFVAVISLWQISRRALALMIATGIGVLAVLKIMPALGAPAMPTIPWEHPTSSNIRAFSQELVTHPIVLASLGVILLGVVLILGALDRVRDRSQPNWIESVFVNAPDDTTSRAFYNLVRDRRSVWIGIALGLMLFAMFFTSMYTNMFGLGSGTVGALGYWLGQHD